MAKCDLCNDTVPSHQLVQLRDQYQIPNVVDICPKCEKFANKTKSDLIDKLAPAVREALQNRKREYEGPRTPSRLHELKTMFWRRP